MESFAPVTMGLPGSIPAPGNLPTSQSLFHSRSESIL